MKRKLATLLLSLCCIACSVGAFACGGEAGKGNSSSSGWGEVYTVQAAYAAAQDLGYSGSLEEFIRSISGKDGVDGTDGKDGADGADGVGIQTLSVNAQGELVVSLTDGKTISLGKIVGKDGQDGKDGVGISSVRILNGELIVILTDTSFINLGNVMGAKGENGVGISSVGVNDDGTATVYYSDGSQENIGKIVGEKGDAGVGISNIEINKDGKLQILLTNDTKIDCGKVVGNDGKDGADGEDGKDGVDGKDGDSVSSAKIDEKGNLVLTFVSGKEVTVGNVVGSDGKDGVDGADGTDGKDGADGVGVKTVEINESGNLVITLTNDTKIDCGKVVGSDGKDGVDGENGEDGKDGVDGVGVKTVEINENGNLVITLTNDTKIDCGKVVGSDGKDGADGEDGKDGVDGENGKDGVGISSVYFNDKNELVVVYTDGSEKVVGTIPICDHIYDDWAVGKEATCTSIGYRYRTCTVCENVEYEFEEKLGHDFSSNILQSSDYRHEVYCARCYEIISSLHTYGDDTTCDDCGYYYSNGLEFTLNADKTSYSVFCSTCTDSNIVIPAMYNGLFVTEVEYYGFSNNTQITSVVLPSSITTIGNCAFWGCTELQRVTIGENVTTIQSSAFLKCTSLQSIVIPDSVTLLGESVFESCTALTDVRIGKGLTIIPKAAFQYCTSLETISIPDNVLALGTRSFSECIKLVDVRLPDSMTSIEALSFARCSSLTDIGIPSGITTISASTFNQCTSLRNVLIPNGVLTIEDGAFYKCTSLTKLTVPDSVEHIQVGAFQYCSSLTSISLPFIGEEKDGMGATNFGVIFAEYSSDGNTAIPSSLKKVQITGGTVIADRAFADCVDLSIDLPDSLEYIGWLAFSQSENLMQAEGGISYVDDWVITCDSSATSVQLRANTRGIAARAFDGCRSLTDVVLPEGLSYINAKAFVCSLSNISIPSSVIRIDDTAFITGDHLKSITVAANNAYYESKSNCLIEKASKTLLLGCNDSIIPTDGSVTAIGDSAFSNCDKLTSVTIPSGVAAIEGNAFYSCNALASVTLPEGLQSIGENAFRYCQSLTSIVIPNSVVSIDASAFTECAELISVTLGDNITFIGARAFMNCAKLTAIAIPDSMTSIEEYTFSGCSALTSVVIGNSVDVIHDAAFHNCSSLTTITIPDSVITIGAHVFSGCTNLTNISMGNNLTSIGSGGSLFADCINLTSVIIPEGITELNIYTFNGCVGLTSVVIPESVTTIDAYVFKNCTQLTNVYYMGTEENWSQITVGSNEYLTSATVYYYSESQPTDEGNYWRYVDGAPTAWA